MRSRSGRGRGQIFEDEAKILASGPLWPRGLNITDRIPTVYKADPVRSLIVSLHLCYWNVIATV